MRGGAERLPAGESNWRLGQFQFDCVVPRLNLYLARQLDGHFSLSGTLRRNKGSRVLPCFSASVLVASLIWGSVGLGYAIFGKKQGEPVYLIGGIVMIALSYFIGSALYMSLASIGLIALMYWLSKRL